MLLQQLTRVKEIDSQISDLHSRLTHLYDERAGLLGFSSLTPEMLNLEAAAATQTPKALYASLKGSWNKHGIALPAQRTLQSKLQKVIGIVGKLVADNPDLAGKLTVVAVPPYKQLAPLATADNFSIAEPALLKAAKKSQVWSLVMVATDTDFYARVASLQTFIGNAEYFYRDYDCRGLGVQELLAAELQGVRLAQPGEWVLLLKDMKANTVPCATLSGDKVLLDTDDTNGLLGQNYLCPAIAVR